MVLRVHAAPKKDNADTQVQAGNWDALIVLESWVLDF